MGVIMKNDIPYFGVPGGGGSILADGVLYDNTETWIESENVQNAIDEIASKKFIVAGENTEETTPMLRDADTLGGRIKAEDIDDINSNLSNLIVNKYKKTGSLSYNTTKTWVTICEYTFQSEEIMSLNIYAQIANPSDVRYETVTIYINDEPISISKIWSHGGANYISLSIPAWKVNVDDVLYIKVYSTSTEAITFKYTIWSNLNIF